MVIRRVVLIGESSLMSRAGGRRSSSLTKHQNAALSNVQSRMLEPRAHARIARTNKRMLGNQQLEQVLCR